MLNRNDMHQIKYLLVNDAPAKGGNCKSSHRYIPYIGHCIEVCCGERSKLLDQLCRLRKHNPDAKILGVSELDLSGNHALVRVSEEMNRLRRELSDLP